jgi:hypothetical protein
MQGLKMLCNCVTKSEIKVLTIINNYNWIILLIYRQLPFTLSDANLLNNLFFDFVLKIWVDLVSTKRNIWKIIGKKHV